MKFFLINYSLLLDICAQIYSRSLLKGHPSLFQDSTCRFNRLVTLFCGAEFQDSLSIALSLPPPPPPHPVQGCLLCLRFGLNVDFLWFALRWLDDGLVSSDRRWQVARIAQVVDLGFHEGKVTTINLPLLCPHVGFPCLCWWELLLLHEQDHDVWSSANEK